ncbi:hypothetical protein BG006_005906 [Podila minutissima]|uniref:Uncharacterized protein n=1 Tax=Podila minutissima TaxID=64525 RepID=A0A9P5SSX5_9FUNG|nr:hypothetical protein BG006_005906 [Podila minutissima]
MNRAGGVKSIFLAPPRYSRLQTARIIYACYADTFVDLNLIAAAALRVISIEFSLPVPSWNPLVDQPGVRRPLGLPRSQTPPDPVLQHGYVLRRIPVEPCRHPQGPYLADRKAGGPAGSATVSRSAYWKGSDLEKGDPELGWWFEVVHVWGTESVDYALRAFSGLEHLRTLELRNLKEYINIRSLGIAKSS